MRPRSPARKAVAVAVALATAATALWLAARVPVMSGTKATFSSVPNKAVPGGGPAATTTAPTPRP